MSTPVWPRLIVAGVLLEIATLGTAVFGIEEILSGAVAKVLLVALAMFKCRLIMLDFMELRAAPLVWRIVPQVWILVVGMIILSDVLLAPSSPQYFSPVSLDGAK